MKALTPNIFTHNMSETIAFYQQLGFELTMSVPESGDNLVWAAMKNGGVEMMFQSFESLVDNLPEVSRSNGGSLLFYIDVQDIQSLFGRLNGQVPILKGLEKTFYGATEFSIKDNNGYVLTFAEQA